MRLSAFPVVSNDPPLLVACIAPVAAHFSLLFSSSFWWWWWSSSSSRWESSTNRSMSCVGIEVFLSLCRKAKREVSALFLAGCEKVRKGARKRARSVRDAQTIAFKPRAILFSVECAKKTARSRVACALRRALPGNTKRETWGRRTIVKIYAL